MTPSEPDRQRLKRPVAGLIDRALIMEEYKAMMIAQIITVGVFRALLLSVFIATIALNMSDPPHAVATLLVATIVGGIWKREEGQQLAALTELRRLLVSRRFRESEGHLYDEYIRLRHGVFAESDGFDLERLFWVLLIFASISASYFKLFFPHAL